MMSAIVTFEESNSMADLLEELGGVSLDRIVRRPAPGTATEADVLRLMEAPRKKLCELIDGTLVEKAMGIRESLLAGSIVDSIRGFVRPKKLGMVTSPDGMIRLWAGRVRIPDVAFFSWDRLPGRRIPDTPVPEIVPDLTVEILSAGNTPEEMELKRHDYFRSGVIEHWEIDPVMRTVQVFRSPDQSSLLPEDGVIQGTGLLEGFTLSLKELFAELDEAGT